VYILYVYMKYIMATYEEEWPFSFRDNIFSVIYYYEKYLGKNEFIYCKFSHLSYNRLQFPIVCLQRIRGKKRNEKTEKIVNSGDGINC
jgi:hypothetical protein